MGARGKSLLSTPKRFKYPPVLPHCPLNIPSKRFKYPPHAPLPSKHSLQHRLARVRRGTRKRAQRCVCCSCIRHMLRDTRTHTWVNMLVVLLIASVSYHTSSLRCALGTAATAPWCWPMTRYEHTHTHTTGVRDAHGRAGVSSATRSFQEMFSNTKATKKHKKKSKKGGKGKDKAVAAVAAVASGGHTQQDRNQGESDSQEGGEPTISKRQAKLRYGTPVNAHLCVLSIGARSRALSLSLSASACSRCVLSLLVRALSLSLSLSRCVRSLLVHALVACSLCWCVLPLLVCAPSVVACSLCWCVLPLLACALFIGACSPCWCMLSLRVLVGLGALEATRAATLGRVEVACWCQRTNSLVGLLRRHLRGRPAEVTSKVPVGRHRKIIQSKKAVPFHVTPPPSLVASLSLTHYPSAPCSPAGTHTTCAHVRTHPLCPPVCCSRHLDPSAGSVVLLLWLQRGAQK